MTHHLRFDALRCSLVLGAALAAVPAWATPAADSPQPLDRSVSPWTAANAAMATDATVTDDSPAPLWPGDTVLQWSGFGTLGWARSNRDWTTQRFIDRSGSFKSDTLLGGQLDLKLGDRWSATVQLTLAPDDRDDRRWRLQPSWAFVAWRPNNDWLLRVGKLRVPFFLRSEQMEVGATYDEVRLPAEIYGIVPTQDFVGTHVARNWAVGQGELSVDAYAGRARQTKRIWQREGIPGALPAGEAYWDVDTSATGLVASWSLDSAKVRLGAHRVRTSKSDGRALPVRPTWVELVPGSGIGYWQTDASLPGPGVETVPVMVNHAYILGAEFSPAPAWKVIAEAGRIVQRNTERSIDSLQAYLTVSREFGAFTPYLTLSQVKSTRTSRDWARQLDETTVPAFVDSTGLLNASMRVAADSVPVYDQHSMAVGSSFSLSPTRKFKAEWQHTSAKASGMFDLAAGEKLYKHRTLDTLSVSYNFVF